MISTIHAEAIHGRAEASRAQAKLAAREFVQIAADHLVTSCPAGVAVDVVQYLEAIRVVNIGSEQFPKASERVDNYFGTLSGPIRVAYSQMRSAVYEATELTKAAQMLSYRATLK